MRRVAALLLLFGLAKLVRRNLICMPKTVLFIGLDEARPLDLLRRGAVEQVPADANRYGDMGA